jgi:hypothetical protein
MFLYTNFQFQDQEKVCCSEFRAGWLWKPLRFLWESSWQNALCAGKHDHDTETNCIPTRLPVVSFIPLLIDTVKWSGRIPDSLLMSTNELVKHQIATITENNKHTLCTWTSKWRLLIHLHVMPMYPCLTACTLSQKVCVNVQSVLLLFKNEM